MSGKVTFIGAGPGAADLITVRGQKALQSADIIFYDNLVDPALLEGLSAEQVFVGKLKGAHSMPQEGINSTLADHALQGKHVVRLKGGDCAVFGRLGEELLHLVERGVPYEVIPGVTSSTAAPTFAGIPVTHRGVSDSFYVVTAHRRDDSLEITVPPYAPSTTIVLMMALTTTETWHRKLLEQGYPEDIPVAYISNGGTPRQQVLETTLGQAPEAVRHAQLASPVMAVVGEVVRLREKLRWFAETQPIPGQNAPSKEGAQPPAEG